MSLAEGGVDDDKNAIALCPNCHREAHFSVDQPALRTELAKRLKEILTRPNAHRNRSSN